MMPEAAEPGPYAQAAALYHQAGWRGPIPLPYAKKKSPPTGWTGQGGGWPSYADLQAWIDGPEGDGNIALRLDPHVLGLDVDNYGDKPGGTTLAAGEAKWGALPPTWRTTSRDDGISGIRMYRVPEGLAWPGELGDGTELIQTRHRYAVVWPSVHPEGRTYRWISPGGAVSTVPPNVDDLPSLPEAWILGLTGGELAVDTPRNNLGGAAAGAWLRDHNTSDGVTHAAPCRRMAGALEAALAELRGPGSAHVAARGHVLRLVRLADQEHQGVLPAILRLQKAFVAAATDAHRTGQVRDQKEAEAEIDRLLVGAVNLVTADPSEHLGVDPCDQPFAGLIAEAPRAEPAKVAELPETPSSAVAERARTSWWPRDLEAVLAGEYDEPEPVVLARSDGRCLFYAAKVNGIIGESESGKTWIALLAVLQELQQHRRVLYLDFEDTAAGIVSRLRSLGASDDELRLLAYIGPDESLTALAAADLDEVLSLTDWTLIVLDGFNAAMSLLGLNINDNNDATRFSQELLKRLSASGAAVVYVDHVPKDKDNRGKGGIGAQAKRAMTTGCAILADVVLPFGRGMTGKLRLSVDKDRPGFVRAVSAGAKSAGNAILTSSEDGTVTIVIEAPDLRPAEERGPFRPTKLMARISHFLETCDGTDGVSRNEIEKSVTGDNNGLRQALDVLVDEHYVKRWPAGRAVLHRLERPFREELDGLV